MFKEEIIGIHSLEEVSRGLFYLMAGQVPNKVLFMSGLYGENAGLGRYGGVYQVVIDVFMHLGEV